MIYYVPDLGRESREIWAGRLLHIRVLAARDQYFHYGLLNEVFFHVESLSARTVCDAKAGRASPLRLLDPSGEEEPVYRIALLQFVRQVRGPITDSGRKLC